MIYYCELQIVENSIDLWKGESSMHIHLALRYFAFSSYYELPHPWLKNGTWGLQSKSWNGAGETDSRSPNSAPLQVKVLHTFNLTRCTGLGLPATPLPALPRPQPTEPLL